MAYNEFLADRVKNILHEKRVVFEAKKMMGGLCFMVDDKMCCGIVKDQLMARIGVDAYEEALTKTGCSEMNFTGRPMEGYVFISPEGVDLEADLAYWIQLCIDFNPFAKSSKKKK
ncbi:MAG: TfoX/Sxy family protein [Vicingus serpentipes]|nr:TfoX/Sxy family protein [Vicingus serpentipes]